MESVEARLRGELGFLSVAAHGGQETAHLGKRGAACLLDAPERVTVLGERVGELVPDGADLEHHHADCMGDDVVQFARDPHALLCHCDSGRRVPFPLGQARAYFRRLGLLGTLAQSEARHPADRELERDEDEHGGCVSGDLVDDGRRPADHEGQADACL